MAEKIIHLNKSVYELCREDSDMAGILEKAGFTDVMKPGMLNTAGRYMTIPKCAVMKKMNLDTIKQILKENGYEIRD